MTLAPGARLGVYEVTALIGEGGMGQVFRATDTRLKRQVAIKILPPALAADPDRLARFQREAEVLASLNHPNIAGVHGLEEQALVMELVEGEDLSQRIAQGAIALDEAIPIARQIAEALEAAHDHGIVHRDLKPANVKVRADGTVKVLDFGLAKAMDAGASAPGSQDPANLASRFATITTPAMTHIGMIIGTAAYMSPEQARGKVVDRRTDIWAFGCVLFEMLTGKRAFEAEDVSMTLAEVMKSEPDWRLLPELPPVLNTFLRQCLKKDPKQRTQSAGDIRLALEGAFDIPAPLVAKPAAVVRPLWRRALPVVGAAVVAGLAGLAGAAGWLVNRPVAPATQRLSVMLPPDQSIVFGCSPCSSIAISPDGTQVAFVSPKPDAVLGSPNNGPLHVRSLGSVTIRDVPGATAAWQPFFSPDGKWLAFFTESGELKKVALGGGNPVTIVPDVGPGGKYYFGTWTDDNTIVIGGTQGLGRVSAEGGALETITTLNAAAGETRHYLPEILPGTEHIFFTVLFGGQKPPRVEAVNLRTKARQIVMDNASAAHYLPGGHLLFQRDEGLMLAPFNSKTMATTGPAVSVADDVRHDGPVADGNVQQLAVSRVGTVAYAPNIDRNRLLGVVSRAGTFEPLNFPADRFGTVTLSPDGQRVAIDVAVGTRREVRIYDLARGTTTKSTQAGSESQPAWSPNGRSLAVLLTKPDGLRTILIREIGGADRTLANTAPRPSSISWSPDGNEVVYVGGRTENLWMAATGEQPDPHAVVTATSREHSPALSPDGRWLAYASEESGRNEVYVRGYPKGERITISTSGAGGPVWSRDGKELFFQGSSDGATKVIAVPVSTEGGALKIGKLVPLFDLRVITTAGIRQQYASNSITGRKWDVFPDGRRFLVSRGADPQDSREIVVVQHWSEELSRLSVR